MKRHLTDVEKIIATRLKTQVTFLPGSSDKRFCLSLDTAKEYAEGHIDELHKCFHKYKRQLRDYQELLYRLSMK